MTALAQRRGACPALTAPMRTGDGLLVRLNPIASGQETGGLSPTALIGLCRSASRHGNGILEITQRGSIQIRGLTPESAGQLADDVNTLHIAVRSGVPVETSPLAGLDPDEIADPRPLAQAIRAVVSNAGLSRRLGPKVSVIVDGSGHIAMDNLLADVRLTAVRQDSETLWHMAIGGTATTARSVGLFGRANAVATTLETLEAIAALGREGRGRGLGDDDFACLRQRCPSSPCRDLPPFTGRRSRQGDEGQREHLQLATFPLTNDTHALAIALPFGSMPAETLAELAREAAKSGATEICSAPDRRLLTLGLTTRSAKALQSKATALGFVTDAADPRLFIAACPGKPACASGHIDTRAIAEQVVRQHAGLFDGSLTLHVSGCAKGCAHPRSAALALVGGENGAGLVVNGTAGARPSGYTGEDEAGSALGRVAALVARQRRAGETAAACLARLDAQAMQAFTAGPQE